MFVILSNSRYMSIIKIFIQLAAALFVVWLFIVLILFLFWSVSEIWKDNKAFFRELTGKKKIDPNDQDENL